MLALLLQLDLPTASNFAPMVDRLYDFVNIVSLVSFVGIVGAIVYFVLRYRRKGKEPEETPYIEGHPLLEASVMFILFIFVMIFFYWGWVDYKKMMHPPPNAMEVSVTGRQWLWSFEYVNGRRADNELVLPKGVPVKLVMNSTDVIHSFYVPAFRVKQDVLPGTYTFLWFVAEQVGTYDVFCTEFCGTGHSAMLAKIKVVEPEEYAKWQKTWEWEKQLGLAPTAGAVEKPAGAPGGAPAPAGPTAMASPAERGEKLYKEKGCNACHSVDGSTLVGPSLKGIFGHEVELEGGKKAAVDENYIRESLTDPNAKLVKGFQPMMPTFKGTLNDDEISSLVAYIKSLQ